MQSVGRDAEVTMVSQRFNDRLRRASLAAGYRQLKDLRLVVTAHEDHAAGLGRGAGVARQHARHIDPYRLAAVARDAPDSRIAPARCVLEEYFLSAVRPTERPDQ